jgi:hypothetical protein
MRWTRTSCGYMTDLPVHPELRGSISTWGNNLDGVRGIDGQLCGQQADGEEAANALERARGASVITSSDTGFE